MDRKTLATVGATAGLSGLIAGLIALLLDQDTIRLDTDVIIDKDGRVLEPVSLRVYGHQSVRWHITNKSHRDLYVQMTNFRLKTSSGYGQPERDLVYPPDPTTDIAVPAMGGTGTLETTVIKTHGSPKHFIYKYDIRTGDTIQTLTVNADPEIDMWDK